MKNLINMMDFGNSTKNMVVGICITKMALLILVNGRMIFEMGRANYIIAQGKNFVGISRMIKRRGKDIFTRRIIIVYF